MKRATWAIGVGAVLVLLLALVLRVAVAGSHHYALGQDALHSGDLPLAQSHFLYAARWWIPGISTSDDAVTELLKLGDEHLKRGEYREAVGAFDDARGALFSTAWMGPPKGALRDRADLGYANALARWKEEQSGESPEINEGRYLELAKESPGPNPWFSLLMGIAFLGYLSSVVMIDRNWGGETGRRWPYALSGTVAFLLWVLALWNI